MTFDANLKAITESHLLPKVVDTVNGANVITFRFLNNMQSWRGETLDKSIKVAESNNGGSFSGMDKFNTNATDTKVRAYFDPRGYEQPVVIPGMEADVNAASNRSVDLVASAIEEAANEMASDIGTLLYGLGTGNSNKDFLGLAAGIDDGGEVATYGGLLRSTYTTWAANETDVGGALTLDAMATMYDSCKAGTDKPTLILTTESIWSDYESLAQPFIGINQDGYRQLTADGMVKNALKGELGFDALTFRGTPVVADEKATSGCMWFINEKYYAFYGLPTTRAGYSQISLPGNTIEGVYSNEPVKSLGFSWSGFLFPDDQYAEIGHILLLGNFVTFFPKRHGVLNTIS